MIAAAAATVLTAGWLVLGAGDRERSPEAREGVVRVVAGGRTVLERPVEPLARAGREAPERLARRVPARRVERRGRARVTLLTDRPRLRAALRRAIGAGGGRVRVPERAVSSTSSLPVVKQVLRNNCETAALSMLLAARGKRAPQLDLQRDLPRSGPLDPKPAGADGLEVWGDPREGFVGRPDGGGTSGGYGVYEPPIEALARRRGLRLERLSRKPPEAIYRRVREGRPVMTWIGLSDGPFETWRTPAGRRFTGNFGEHTVVLTGLRGDRLAVNDPLSGRRLEWSKAEWERLWARLGRRALAA